MGYLWDYDEKELRKTKAGRLFISERMINYGPGMKRKLSLTAIKKNWSKLRLFRPQKRLLELLIWGKYRSSPKSRKPSFFG